MVSKKDVLNTFEVTVKYRILENIIINDSINEDTGRYVDILKHYSPRVEYGIDALNIYTDNLIKLINKSKSFYLKLNKINYNTNIAQEQIEINNEVIIINRKKGLYILKSKIVKILLEQANKDKKETFGIYKHKPDDIQIMQDRIYRSSSNAGGGIFSGINEFIADEEDILTWKHTLKLNKPYIDSIYNVSDIDNEISKMYVEVDKYIRRYYYKVAGGNIITHLNIERVTEDFNKGLIKLSGSLYDKDTIVIPIDFKGLYDIIKYKKEKNYGDEF